MRRNAKTFFVLSLSSLVITASLSAADGAQIKNLENRVSALESRKSPSGVINPPARPTQKDGTGGYAFGDVLLWQAHENGLGFAVIRTPSNPIGKSKNLNFNWSWGFRLGAGINLPHDGWDVGLKWTRFHTNARRNVIPSAGETILPANLHPLSSEDVTLRATTAKGHWNLHLNELDLELARSFYVSRWLVLKPHMGLSTAWVRQRLKDKYFDLVNDAVGFVRRDARLKCKYWGLGLIGGLDTQWNLGGGVSLFADLALSLLYGFFDIDDKELAFSADDVRTTEFDFDDHYRLGRAITQMAFGLKYDYIFCDGRTHLGVQAGWEHQMWFGQNQFPRFVSSTAQGVYLENQGDLTLQGYTIRVRMDF